MSEIIEFWAKLPFHFWSVFFFVLGCNIGSFLNVCIYRMPLGQSIVSPPSHCPHCHYRIPWYLNIPLIPWLVLRGRCAHCGARISGRYFLVELLAGVVFLGTWLWMGGGEAFWTGWLLTLVYAGFFSGLIVATFIDLEHFIIPDELTLGGMGVGFVLAFLFPALHAAGTRAASMKQSILGILVGAGVVYLILQVGKLLFGRQEFNLPETAKIRFTETSLILPDKEIPYEEIFCRDSDTILLEATRVELPDRCYPEASIRLTPHLLRINEDEFDPAGIPVMEMWTDHLVVPREAMGLGDVKFMGAIGAFLGWQATLFTLMLSSMIGAGVGITLILVNRREWSSRIPYGPYIAAAAMIWVFGGKEWTFRWLAGSL